MNLEVARRGPQGALRFVHGLLQLALGGVGACHAVMTAGEVRLERQGVLVARLGFLEEPRRPQRIRVQGNHIRRLRRRRHQRVGFGSGEVELRNAQRRLNDAGAGSPHLVGRCQRQRALEVLLREPGVVQAPCHFRKAHQDPQFLFRVHTVGARQRAVQDLQARAGAAGHAIDERNATRRAELIHQRHQRRAIAPRCRVIGLHQMDRRAQRPCARIFRVAFDCPREIGERGRKIVPVLGQGGTHEQHR